MVLNFSDCPWHDNQYYELDIQEAKPRKIKRSQGPGVQKYELEVLRPCVEHLSVSMAPQPVSFSQNPWISARDTCAHLVLPEQVIFILPLLTFCVSVYLIIVTLSVEDNIRFYIVPDSRELK